MGNIKSILFEGCNNLDKLASGGVDAKTVCRDGMFKNTGLITVPEDLFVNYNGNTSSAQDLFYRCSSLEYVPSGLFKGLNNLTNAKGLFFECTSLSMFLDDVLFSDFSSVTTLRDCFRKCKLTGVHTNAFQGLSSIENLYSVFEFCTTLTEIPQGLLDNLSTLVNINELIANCGSFTYIPDDLFTPTKHPNLQSAVGIFANVTLSDNIYEVWNLNWSNTAFNPANVFHGFTSTNSSIIPADWK